MAADQFGERYTRKQKNKKLSDLSRSGMTPEEIAEEEQILRDAPKVEPIKAGDEPGRNDPCPCGSGRKYKKCCWGKKDPGGRKEGGGLLGAIKRKLSGDEGE